MSNLFNINYKFITIFAICQLYCVKIYISYINFETESKMSRNPKTIFFCQECGYESPKWQGQCICGAWNTFVEEKFSASESKKKSTSLSADRKTPPSPLVNLENSSKKIRVDTGVSELNRVLGGGIIDGSLTLISGEPGIGKSTIIMQVANHIANTHGNVLYVSGEESQEQIKIRADRICSKLSEKLYVISETNLDVLDTYIEKIKPVFLIIDSIQTMNTDEITSSPGSVSQVRACGNRLMQIGKEGGIPIFIVAHVTKSGELAGPKIVEHLVDTVLSFTGDRTQDLRILRATKNRFGTTSELGAFAMTEKGLSEIPDVSKVFLDEISSNTEGSVISAVYEGTRPLFLEVQALAAPTTLGFPRRSAVGFDLARLNMILAVLERKAGLPLSTHDIYVNIVGGIKPEGTYSDLSIAMAIYSSFREKILLSDTVVIGELGLTGELRGIQNCEKIIKEADRMGLKKIILPYKNYIKSKDSKPKAIEIIGAKNIGEALKNFTS